MPPDRATSGPGPRLGAAAIVPAAALLGWAATLAVFAPGYAMYDTLTQYAQALSGRYDDWHPPVMARLWALLAPQTTGTAPLFALQVTGWWAGIALIATALDRADRRRAAIAALAVGILPPFLGWQVAVLKDAQMVAALLLATALVGAPRLSGKPTAHWRWAMAGVMFAYACLVRANAAFAVAPLVALLLPGGWRRRTATAVAGVALVLAISPTLNHRVLRAAPSGVERTQAIFDLAGIAARAGGGPLPAAAVEHIRARGCVRPFFWDPLGEPGHCAADTATLRTMPVRHLYGALAGQILAHPLAYAAHRLAHLNSTERWIVPLGWSGAAPPTGDEPGDHGLKPPGAPANAWQRLGGWLVETPLGWPFAFAGLALAMLVALGRRADAPADLARALLVSALALEASFAVISIASDLRYHLWAMTATALAIAIGWARADRTTWAIGLFVVALTLVPATAARLMLAPVLSSYQAMLG